MYIYIYIYMCMCMYVYTYIYTYIYIYREREMFMRITREDLDADSALMDSGMDSLSSIDFTTQVAKINIT